MIDSGKQRCLISLVGVLWTLSMLSGPASAQTTAAFEVASVRPSAEQVSQTSAGVHIDGSQVRIVGLPLKLYVGMAYGLKPQQISAAVPPLRSGTIASRFTR